MKDVKGMKCCNVAPLPAVSIRRGDRDGNRYYCEQLHREGWLCQSLFKYYRTAPRTIYLKAEQR